MKATIKEWGNGVECTVKLKDRRVSVMQFNKDNSFGFHFIRLDDTTDSVVLEEKPHKRISTLKIRLSEEATKAITVCIAEIIKYRFTLK